MLSAFFYLGRSVFNVVKEMIFEQNKKKIINETICM